MTFKIDVPDISSDRLTNALCKLYGYDIVSLDTDGNIVDKGTQDEFARQQIVNFLLKAIKDAEVGQQVKDAEATISADVATIAISVV